MRRFGRQPRSEDPLALEAVVRSAAQRNVADVRRAIPRERYEMVELELTSLRAPALRADERTPAAIARRDFALHMRRDVAAMYAYRLRVRARPRGLCCSRLLQVIHQCRQRPTDNLRHVTIGDSVAHQILRASKIGVGIGGESHTQQIPIGRERRHPGARHGRIWNCGS